MGIKGKGFYPTHTELWESCEVLLNHGNSLEKGGFHFHLPAMLFAFLSYEAYLNFVGHFVAPKQWQNEREFFGKGDYQGVKGKFTLLQEKLDIVLDKNKPPYNIVACLEQFRDFVSHGKPEYYSITNAAFRKDNNFPFSAKLDSWVTPEKAKKAKEAISELCSIIHLQAKKVVNNRRFGETPFSAYEELEITG